MMIIVFGSSALLSYEAVSYVVFPMTWFVIFACSAFGLFFWRQYRARQSELASPLADHRLGLRHIGQTLTLEQPIRNGAGRIKIASREWNVRGPELPVGAQVRVTGVDGSVLLVDRVSAKKG